ncbi:hypothetical protein WH06_16000 [Aeromonas salmonicida subsp. salmonicida]|nr:hypothetical protein C5P03_10370 [Aeromonas salmonicida subsp. salmonicida 01-B526]KHE97307.1 hypothetical protein NV17_12890 [Aeromonas salmonicida subsp. salmonicida]ORJ12529.1 hypothetical protein A7D02_11180 [Aeromonas salmonicida]KIX24833.1 hypothetical protein TM02_12525 [Aeromonas salmonicida subsp. salmonicida]KTA89202.1 hypothetical protein UC37_11935 [Aeromonas salmonicida subsp. salmonicida]
MTKQYGLPGYIMYAIKLETSLRGLLLYAVVSIRYIPRAQEGASVLIIWDMPTCSPLPQIPILAEYGRQM